MKELPSKWTIALLKEVANDCQPGFACGNKDEKDGLKHLRMNNISVNGTLNLDIIRKVPKVLAREQHYLRKGDILVCTTNSAKLVGKCALFNLKGEYAFSNHLTRLRADTRIVSSKWLQISLWHLWRLGTFENKCKHWVNQSTLPKEAFLASKVVLPPLNEQHRIVDKLEKLLTRVNNCKDRLDKIPGLLKRFRQSVLAAACSGRLTADWREKNPDVEPTMELLKMISEEKAKKNKKVYSNM
jgi:type I restriction enzyme S subunit